ncbi:hypothetical protein QA596_11520 [Balneolales bacterium ANBcel1]|nr:hypothetical protein [Balneolales bacterium ANBcel1]
MTVSTIQTVSKHLPAVVAAIIILGLACNDNARAHTPLSNASAEKPARTLSSFEVKPSLYLDCQQCDYNYIREHIRFVNYVRDRQQADIHVFITTTPTGDGGRQYEFSFIGRGTYSDIRFDFTRLTGRDMTDSQIREHVKQAIEMGLAPFMIQTPIGDRFDLQFHGVDEDLFPDIAVDDPWNHWVFEIYAGRFQLQLESQQKNFDSRWGVWADRVTDDWKFRIRPYFNYHYEEIDREDEEKAVSHRHRHGLDTYAIKSITDHWSIGLFGDYLTRKDRNTKHRIRITPGIEYSIFPYDEATRRSITLRYLAGYTYIDYYEPTIFDKTEQQLLNQRVEIRSQYTQPWGNINLGVIGSHYFHDFDFRRLDTYLRLSIRLTEGLSLSFQTDYNIVQDQLTLRAGEQNLEDILLAQQEMATDYYLRGLIAISYTFGSDFANIVNTRF